MCVCARACVCVCACTPPLLRSEAVRFLFTPAHTPLQVKLCDFGVADICDAQTSVVQQEAADGGGDLCEKSVKLVVEKVTSGPAFTVATSVHASAHASRRR